MLEQILVPVYCERGVSMSLLAEPINVASNGAYLVAAWLAWRRTKVCEQALEKELTALIVLALAIGIGSAWFHLLGTRTAWLADIVPIGAFMIVYLVVAARRLLGWSRWMVAGAAAAFAGALWLASRMLCVPSLMPMTTAARMPCLNGSLTYVPAVAGLVIVAGLGFVRAPVAARHLLVAGIILTVALAARTLDLELCPESTILGMRLGMHAFWHCLAALAIYAMLRAVPRFRRPQDRNEVGAVVVR